MSWMYIVSLATAVAVGVNLGVILMALIQSGAREDQRGSVPRGGRP